eukprot:1766251-Karenia_brevis.AAC.1
MMAPVIITIMVMMMTAMMTTTMMMLMLVMTTIMNDDDDSDEDDSVDDDDEDNDDARAIRYHCPPFSQAEIAALKLVTSWGKPFLSIASSDGTLRCRYPPFLAS